MDINEIITTVEIEDPFPRYAVERTVPFSKFERVVAKSKRRRTAIKQLQKALDIQTAVAQQLANANKNLHKENWRLIDERGTEYRKMREQFYSQSWFCRLFGRF